jgi:hypothetical protein
MGPNRSDRADAALHPRLVRYEGKPFAPATKTYLLGDAATLNLSTRADSGYGPSPVGRIADLGAVAPLALAALWEAAFAYEAGPLSTWNN